MSGNKFHVFSGGIGYSSFLSFSGRPVHITYIYYSFESVTIEYEVEMAWEEYEYVQILYYIIDGIVPYFMFYLSAH